MRSLLGSVAGSVAGIFLAGASRSDGGRTSSLIVSCFGGAAVGFLLGLAVPPLWQFWKPRMVGSALGTLAGVVAGVLMWILAWAWGSWNDWEMKAGISEFGFDGAVLGFLLGFGIQLIAHGWKLLTSAQGPAQPPAAAGPLGADSGPPDPRA
jgi:hypothetical protein